MKTFKSIQGFRRSNAVKKIKAIIDLHEQMRNCYFWTPPTTASARRNYEKQRSNDLDFVIENTKYQIEQKTDCSCKNIYYKLQVWVDDERKNISALKKLVK